MKNIFRFFLPRLFREKELNQNRNLPTIEQISKIAKNLQLTGVGEDGVRIYTSQGRIKKVICGKTLVLKNS